MKRVSILYVLIMCVTVGCSGGNQASGEIPNIETGIDPDAWVLVPSGEFLMGMHEHETMLEYPYEIMVTDVTNSQFADYLNEALEMESVQIETNGVFGFYPGDEFHGHEHEEQIFEGDYLHIPLDDPGLRLFFDGNRFSPISGYENHPVVMVTWFGAKAFCDFYGWRLPSEMEWEKSARGNDNRPFPWGYEIEPRNANFYSSYDVFEKTFGKQGNTTPVGFYNGRAYQGFQTLDSPSLFGLYDMAGNVWQWTGDVYPEQHYRYMRGGSKDNYAYNLRVWTRNSAGPTYYSPVVGFRCARTP